MVTWTVSYYCDGNAVNQKLSVQFNFAPLLCDLLQYLPTQPVADAMLTAGASPCVYKHWHLLVSM